MHLCLGGDLKGGREEGLQRPEGRLVNSGRWGGPRAEAQGGRLSCVLPWSLYRHCKGNPTCSTPASLQASWPLRCEGASALGVLAARTLKGVQLLAEPSPSTWPLDRSIPKPCQCGAFSVPAGGCLPNHRAEETALSGPKKVEAKPRPSGPQAPHWYYETSSAA